MAQYRNYAGELVTCPKAEGTCWQPEHLTKAQQRILVAKSRRANGDDMIDPYFVSAGVAADDSEVSYDAYQPYVDNYGETIPKGKLPKHTAVAALYDFAKEALGEGSNVIIQVFPDEEDGRNGKIRIATALDEYDYYLDSVNYSYKTVDGETSFYRKKKLFRKPEKVTHTMLQEDIAKARDGYQRLVDARAANTGQELI